MRPAGLILLAMLLATSCGGPTSPTSPQTVSTPAVDRVVLATGAYDFFAYQLTSAPECGITGSLGTAAINSHVILSHEGTESVARASSPADGDVEVRFHDSGENILSGPPGTESFLNILATIRGTAIQPQTLGADGVSLVVDAVAATAPSKGFVVLSGATTIFVESVAPIAGTATFTTGQASRTCKVSMTWALTKPFGLAP